MNLAQLRQRTRVLLDDLVVKYKWSDPELDHYINEAEREAAERALLLSDSKTDAVCRLTVKANTPEYELSGLVIYVQRAKLDSQKIPLDPTSTEEMDEEVSGWETLTGTPRRYVIQTNGGAQSIRFDRTPTAADVLRLTVYRLPLADMKDNDDCPEIHYRLHERMLNWVQSLAYLKRDTDTYNPIKAADYAARFEVDFGYRHDANATRKRYEKRSHTVQYAW